MPTEDPGPDAPRIGTELELFKPTDTGRAFRKPPPLVVPAPRRRFSPRRRAVSGWSVDDDADLRRARLTVVLVSFAAVVALITVVAVAHHRDNGPTPSAADQLILSVPPFPVPPAPVPVTVEPASSAPSPPRPPAPPARRSPKPSRTPSRVPPAPPAPPAPPTPVTVNLTVGSVISLQVAGRPGALVRHDDYLGRVDEYGPDSGAQARLDATFRVGKATVRGCVSLESVNVPGYFLRHRDFVIRLDRADDSPLFLQDSAFCQVDVGSGAIVLRSVNYPDHYVTEGESALFLTEVDPTAATRFLVRPPV
jgi:alpha-L-arabinofuranosidase B-like protein